jgi:hypothetical protein
MKDATQMIQLSNKSWLWGCGQTKSHAMSFHLVMSQFRSRQPSLTIVVYSSPVAKNNIVDNSLQSALFVAHDLLIRALADGAWRLGQDALGGRLQ